MLVVGKHNIYMMLTEIAPMLPGGPKYFCIKAQIDNTW